MYYVYILRLSGGLLYTGITTDLARRFRQHAGEISGGAKATRINAPLQYEAAWRVDSKSAALKLEARLKRLSHIQKERIISDGLPEFERVLLSEDGTSAL